MVGDSELALVSLRQSGSQVQEDEVDMLGQTLIISVLLNCSETIQWAEGGFQKLVTPRSEVRRIGDKHSIIVSKHRL